MSERKKRIIGYCVIIENEIQLYSFATTKDVAIENWFEFHCWDWTDPKPETMPVITFEDHD